jgi:hypothetical protein
MKIDQVIIPVSNCSTNDEQIISSSITSLDYIWRNATVMITVTQKLSAINFLVKFMRTHVFMRYEHDTDLYVVIPGTDKIIIAPISDESNKCYKKAIQNLLHSSRKAPCHGLWSGMETPDFSHYTLQHSF